MQSPTFWRSRLDTALCAIVLISVPAVGFFSGLAYFGYSLKNFTPGSPNDQIGYFLESQGFRYYGFNTGFFTVDERPAPLSFIHFGVHGPLFPVLYGTLGRCFGISYVSGPLFNVLMLTSALAVYCWLTRPSKRLLFWLGIFFLSFWPYYGVVYSWMQETTHLAIAVVIAGIVTALLVRRPLSATLSFRAAAVAFICAAALLRISWALMLPPLFVLFLKRPSGRMLVVALGTSCALILTLMVAFRWICAPFTNNPIAFMMIRLLTLDVRFEDFLQLVLGNIDQLGHSDSVLERLVFDQHWAALAVAGVLATLAAVVRYAPWKWPRSLLANVVAHPGDVLFCLYNQGVITLATVTTYIVGNGGGIRIFSIHLLLTLLIAAAAQKQALRLLFFAVMTYNTLMWAPCLEHLRILQDPSFTKVSSLAKFRKTIGPHIIFKPGANAWDNTLLSDRLPLELSALPAGIGVSWFSNLESLSKAKSHYIIATPDKVAKAGLKLKFVRTLKGLRGEIGQFTEADPCLYLNLSAAR